MEKVKIMENYNELRKVQEVELEILNVVHQVCVENHLKYSLAYGTLIGAVRHQGFIPWDDDIDICMPREDYDKFLKIVCVENHLKYSLAYGTLIGAVRHQGFIPWDDDIDICMPREDYDKFLKIWSKYNFKDYILQNIETDEDFTQNFTKIRKNHTTFLQPKEEQYKYHKGFFIDIFPGDRVPDSKIKQYYKI